MKSDPKSLEHQIKVSMLAYPSLFQERGQVINHLYCVLGNGYEWLGGRLVGSCNDDTMLDTVEAMLATGASENDIKARVVEMENRLGGPYLTPTNLIKNCGIEAAFSELFEHKLGNYSVYGVCDLCQIMKIPDDVRGDWLAGAEEAVLLMETKNSWGEKDTAENRRLAPIVRGRIAVLKLTVGLSDSERYAKLQEEHDKLLLKVKRLRLVERRCSPSVVCKCPEFCGYHARSNLESMKLENTEITNALRVIVKAVHEARCHNEYGKFIGCQCAKGVAQKALETVSKKRSK